MSLKKAGLLIVIILLIDQISKIYIKTHFHLQESVEVFKWFKIYFIENRGMAWGTKINDLLPFISERTGKLILTVFRIFAVSGIAYWLWLSVKEKRTKLLIVSIALIFAGAVGNIIDSVFYGVLFSDSYHQVATFLPETGGYETLLHGRVVDMLYFPIWNGELPQWIPGLGGKHFTFFEPVFNIADVSISFGVAILIAFNKYAFSK